MNRKLLLLPLLLMTWLTYSFETHQGTVSAEARPKEPADYQEEIIEILKRLDIPFTVDEAERITVIYPNIRKRNIAIPAFAGGFLSALLTSNDKYTAAFTLAGVLSGGFIGGLYERTRSGSAREAYKEALTETFQQKTQKACEPFLSFPKLLKLTGNYTDIDALVTAINEGSKSPIDLCDARWFLNYEFGNLREIIEALQNELSSTADNHRDLTRETHNTIEYLNNHLDKYFLKPIETNKALLNS